MLYPHRRRWLPHPPQVVTAEAGCVEAPDGRKLALNPEWTNPSGKWHVGLKRAFDLFTSTLINRLKKERRKVRESRTL